MRKRLRKKRRLGEFQELCFEVAFSLPPDWHAGAYDAFWDAFIGEAIEAQRLIFAGGCGQHWDGIVAGERQTRVGEWHRAAIGTWLGQHPAATDVVIGPLYDAWHHRPVQHARQASLSRAS